MLDKAFFFDDKIAVLRLAGDVRLQKKLAYILF